MGDDYEDLIESGAIVEPPCTACKWLWAWPQCWAFPKGIPDEVRDGLNNHTEPIVGDHGLQFEPLSSDRELTEDEIERLTAAFRDEGVFDEDVDAEPLTDEDLGEFERELEDGQD